MKSIEDEAILSRAERLKQINLIFDKYKENPNNQTRQEAIECLVEIRTTMCDSLYRVYSNLYGEYHKAELDKIKQEIK